MNTQYEPLLDQCVRRVLFEGAAIDECLSLFPEDLRPEVEAQLWLAARVAGSTAGLPSAGATERARLRLQNEMASLRAQDRARAARRPLSRWPLPSLRGAWGMAAAATAALFLLALGGAGVVAASGSASPGGTLYPVKRAVEDARMAVTFSQESKASLRLAYAERRTEELARLVEEGDASKVPSAQAALQQQLDTVTATINSLPNQGAAASLTAQLQTSSSMQLARLQEALLSAPEQTKHIGGTTLQVSGEAYGTALEAALNRAPQQTVQAEQGAIQLRITDGFPPDVQKVLVSLAGIEVQRTVSGKNEWLDLVSTPVTFDLLQVKDVQKLLASVAVDPGTYLRVRFTISQVSVVSAAGQQDATVEDSEVVLFRPFTVEAGKTTVLLMDFGGDRALRLDARGQYVVTPSVRLLAQDSSTRLLQEKRQEELQKRTGETTQPQGATIVPPLEKDPVKVQIEGRVDEISPDSVTVNNQPLDMPGGSELASDVLKGNQNVKVKAEERPDGSLSILDMEVEAPVQPTSTPTPASAVGSQAQPPRVPEHEAEQPARDHTVVHLLGIIKSINGDDWKVGDKRVHVDDSVKVQGKPKVGAPVRVDGVFHDGVLEAQAVIVGQAPPTPTPVAKTKPKPSPDPTAALATITAKPKPATPASRSSGTPTRSSDRSRPTPTATLPPTPTSNPPTQDGAVSTPEPEGD